MRMRCCLVIFFVVLISSAMATSGDMQYSNRGKSYVQKDAEYMGNGRFNQQLAGLRALMRGAQLLRELQAEWASNTYPSRISRACYFSPVQCLLMKKDGGMNDLIKSGQAYDVLSSNQSPQLEPTIVGSNFGRGWTLPQRYRPG